MNKMIVMCGLPRSGKSTWIKENIIKKDLVYDKIEWFDIDDFIKFFYKDEYLVRTIIKENVGSFFNIIINVLAFILSKYQIEVVMERKFSKPDKYIILSADDIRIAIHGKDYVDELEPFVWCVREYILRYLILKGYNIIIDETNLTFERRYNIFNIVNKCNKRSEYEIECDVMDVSVDDVLKRTENNDMKKLIRKKYNTFFMPNEEEDFDKIIFIKGEIQMFDLKKATDQVEKSFVVRLEKEYEKTGEAHNIKASVKFVVDISGSMNTKFISGKLYSDGTVNSVVQRFFAVAKVLDDNGVLEMYPFSEQCEELIVPVQDNNYMDYVEKEIMQKKKSWYFGGTDYVPMIKLILEHSQKLPETKPENEMPQLILCVVDGDTANKDIAKQLIIKSAKKPIFWLFIGIGKNNNFEFLETLDDIPESERLIDNVDFKKIDDINKISDKELYDMIAEEFIPWFYKAKGLNIF